jgi:rare lipoprotein A (peptidoglycan hydrolase)
VVTVSANGFSVRVQLTDSCQCYGTRLVDLDVRDFSQLAPLSQGLTEVTISWK